jgi:hypothetical protein
MARLPLDLRRRADLAGSGELLWPPEAAIDAIQWMKSQSLGILGLEIYGPFDQARGQFQYEWIVAPGWSRDLETWGHYVDRATDLATREIDTGALRSDVSSGHVDLRYFIPISTEAEYRASASPAPTRGALRPAGR